MASMMMIILKQFANLICRNNDFQQLCQLNYEQDDDHKLRIRRLEIMPTPEFGIQ